MILQTISSITPDKMAHCVVWHLTNRTTENRFSIKWGSTDAELYVLGTVLSASTDQNYLTI